MHPVKLHELPGVCQEKGDKFVAGIDAEAAYQASADTQLQALRKWIHYVGSQVVK